MNSDWNLSRIDSIQRTSLYVVAAFCAGSLFFMSISVTLGVLLGGLTVVVNFRWLRSLIERAMAGGERGKRALYGEYLIKLLLFLAIPCGMIYYRRFLFNLNPLAFVVGLSTIFIAIFVEGIRGFLREVR
jgi:hypothetical protein